MNPTPCDSTILHRIVDELRNAPDRRVPELHCPFEPALHEGVEEIQARSVAWARAVGLAPGEPAARRLAASKIGWLVARAYPCGASLMVQIAADWTTLFCLLDDHLERLENPAAVAAYLADLASLFQVGGEPGNDPMKRACSDLRARLLGVAPAAWQARFNERISQLFNAFSREAAVRAARSIPDLDTYLPMREVTVGLYVEFQIGELAAGIELDPHVRRHPVLTALARKASNIVGWANDLHTYEKELRQGETLNLVAVLARSEGLALADALARAAEKHDEEVRSFVALAADLPAFGGTADEHLHRYVAMLRAWVRGHLDWAHETGRYDPRREPRRAAA